LLIGRAAIGGDDRGQERSLPLGQDALVFLRVVAAFRDERAQGGVLLPPVEVEPGELGKDLQVAHLRGPEPRRRDAQRGLVVAGPAQGEQLREPREAADQVLGMGHEGRAQQVDLLGLVEPVRGGQAQAELRLARLSAHVGVELVEQGGHEVEGHADLRGLGQELHHPPVVLQGMEADPGQDERAVERIPVRRLVHVPEHGHVRGHGRENPRASLIW